MMSRSRNVSLRRRTEPASETAIAAGSSRSAVDDRLHRRQPSAEQVAVGLRALRLVCERGEDLLLALRPETRERPQPLALCRGLELVERLDAELTPDAGRGLRAEPGQLHEEDDLRRDALLVLRERFDLAHLDDLDDLLLDRLADALQLLRASVERELGDRPRRLAHPRGRPAIRDDTERVLALELEQVGEKLDLVGDLGVLQVAPTLWR